MASVKCVAVGHPVVGKTAMIRTYVGDKNWPSYAEATTLFDHYSANVVVDGRPCHLDLFDTPGLEDYDRIRPLAYPQTDVFLVCFSVHDGWRTVVSLENMEAKWIPEIKHHCPKVPFILVGMKTDLRKDENATKELSRYGQDPVTMEMGQEIARKVGAVKYMECSALTKEGLANVFEEAIRVVLSMSASPKPQGTTFNIIKKKQLELLDVIGQGGFGAVFRGKWKARKGEVVAVKKCTLTGTKRDPDIPREVQILSSVPQHPHIISFYGICINYPDILIVTEFAEKGSLFNYLHKEKQVPTVDQSLAWALQVAQGMAFLHNHDIIHRDLKSANILLSTAMAAKVCDFGTARYLSHTTVQTKASGTFRWMAPEVMEAVEANINKKCDSFSYGMVVYELFVHQVPYHDTPGDGVVCVKVLQGELPAIPPTIPPYLHSLLSSCWQKDPHKRPTFNDVILSLHDKSL